MAGARRRREFTAAPNLVASMTLRRSKVDNRHDSAEGEAAGWFSSVEGVRRGKTKGGGGGGHSDVQHSLKGRHNKEEGGAVAAMRQKRGWCSGPDWLGQSH
jgi:hypothetical protein